MKRISGKRDTRFKKGGKKQEERRKVKKTKKNTEINREVLKKNRGGNKVRGRQNKLPREKKLQKCGKNREDRKKTGNTREKGKKEGEKSIVQQLEANS